ncbi:MAG: NTP transferase domain-containing protein [Clostridia bacterium]|nr:NTP transferase domain-containing protein [Clostridia bacterium]
MNIGCIVLAAGKGERFGGRKLTRDLLGKPVLERTLEAVMAAPFSRRICVVREDATEEICRRNSMPSVRYAGGPLSESIRLGMEQMLEMDGCMFVNADQPLLSSISLKRMCDVFSESPDAILRLSFQGRPGSPVLFPKASFPALLRLQGETGGREVIRSGEYPIAFLEAEKASELLDVDTEELFRKAEEILRQSISAH